MRVSDPGGREARILVGGVSAADRTATSTLGPFGDATVTRELDLAGGSEITAWPENAVLTVRRVPDGQMVHDGTGS